MKLLKQIPEAAMVAAFLKAEIFSPRFGEDVRKAMQSCGVDDAIITHPDITNDQENELRARVLGECRGYRQNREMFEGVPTNLSWYEAKLSHNEIGDLRYVDYSYWNTLTDGTHLVKDGVRNIQKGKVVFDVPNDRFLTLAEAIRNGKHDFEPIILWGQNIDSPLEILEGHLRTTAFALAGDTAPAVIKVLVGVPISKREKHTLRRQQENCKKKCAFLSLFSHIFRANHAKRVISSSLPLVLLSDLYERN